ncbi:MAG: transposase, partial [Candidatus Brocadia sp.]
MLPLSVLATLETLSEDERREYYRLFSKRIEELLDAGYGSCILKDERVSRIIADALLHFNNIRYVLDAWVIVPNHVHVLVKPLGDFDISQILHTWKSFTANEINKIIGKKGQLWMHESYDHIVRNETAFKAIRNYIIQNPVKAGGITLPKCNMSIYVNESKNKNVFDTLGKSRDAFDTLFSYDDDTNPFDEKATDTLINAIHNLKLLNPAVGSGAFPMGALHTLVHILHKLDPHNEKWKAEQIKAVSHITDPKIRQETIEKIEEIFELNELDYGRKLYLIQNCIYGVDIQPIAIQIAKLRFFISLLVDEKVDKTKPNYGIEPLPNL